MLNRRCASLTLALLVASCSSQSQKTPPGSASIRISVGEQEFTIEGAVEATLLSDSLFLYTENAHVAVWLTVPKTIASMGEQEIGVLAGETASLSVHVKDSAPRSTIRGLLRITKVEVRDNGLIQLAIEDAEKPADAFGDRIIVNGAIEGTLRPQ